MRRWLIVLVLVVSCGRSERATPSSDAVLDDFHAIERQCLTAFNDALHQQKANQIDELRLAFVLDHDVLPPWRAMRHRVEAASISDPALKSALEAYLADRQTAWEAYATALRSPSDDAAKPHYDAYHQADAAADADARRLGALFRAGVSR